MRFALLAALGIGLSVTCGSADRPRAHALPTTVAEYFATPIPAPDAAWRRNGQWVPGEEISAAAGPQHCGWQSATFLELGWPLGSRPTTAAGIRQYVRDPDRLLPDLPPLQVQASLPTDAVATGYFAGPVQLYFSPRDQDRAAYLVLGSSVERWPRSDHMAVCV